MLFLVADGLCCGGGDGAQAGIGGRCLVHLLGSGDEPVQCLSFRNGFRRVVSDRRIDFDSNAAVYSTSPVAHGAEDVASPTDVMADHRTGGFLRRDASRPEVLDLAGVVRAVCQRLLEMVGLVVTPTTWRSCTRVASPPPRSRPRLRVSSQMDTP